MTIAHSSHLCDDLMPSILRGWDYNMKYIAIQIQYNCQIISEAIITLLRQTQDTCNFTKNIFHHKS